MKKAHADGGDGDQRGCCEDACGGEGGCGDEEGETAAWRDVLGFGRLDRERADNGKSAITENERIADLTSHRTAVDLEEDGVRIIGEESWTAYLVRIYLPRGRSGRVLTSRHENEL